MFDVPKSSAAARETMIFTCGAVLNEELSFMNLRLPARRGSFEDEARRRSRLFPRASVLTVPSAPRERRKKNIPIDTKMNGTAAFPSLIAEKSAPARIAEAEASDWVAESRAGPIGTAPRARGDADAAKEKNETAKSGASDLAVSTTPCGAYSLPFSSPESVFSSPGRASSGGKNLLKTAINYPKSLSLSFLD